MAWIVVSVAWILASLFVARWVGVAVGPDPHFEPHLPAPDPDALEADIIEDVLRDVYGDAALVGPAEGRSRVRGDPRRPADDPGRLGPRLPH